MGKVPPCPRLVHALDLLLGEKDDTSLRVVPPKTEVKRAYDEVIRSMTPILSNEGPLFEFDKSTMEGFLKVANELMEKISELPITQQTDEAKELASSLLQEAQLLMNGTVLQGSYDLQIQFWENQEWTTWETIDTGAYQRLKEVSVKVLGKVNTVFRMRLVREVLRIVK